MIDTDRRLDAARPRRQLTLTGPSHTATEDAVGYDAAGAGDDAAGTGDGADTGTVGDVDRAAAEDGDVAAGHGAVDAGEALAVLRHATDLVARADLEGLSDRGLLEHTVALDRQVTRLQAQRLRALGQVDTAEAYTADACVTAGSWLRHRTRRDPNVGARLRRWTRRLERFPTLRDAFRAGEVTLDHVVAVLRKATPRRLQTLADHEDALVGLARQAEPRHVAVAVRRICDAIDHREPDCGPDEARELFHARTWRGRGDLRGTLDAVTAERFDNLLHAYSQPDGPDTPDDRKRTPAQIRHDAFDAILRAAEQHPDVSSVQGARPHLLIYADLFTLLGRDDLASRPTVRLGSGTEIDLQRIVHLLEDAKATGVLGLGPFRPVAFGRTRRVIPDWLRPVLAMIHGTCIGPGCDRPIAWTQAMHTDGDWHHGATTELDSTGPGCPEHHWLVDVVGWNVDLDPTTATATWASPDRRTIIHTHPPDP